jgi:hypothetical protein
MTRLLRIELRRSAALWFVPVLAVLVMWGTSSTMRPDGAPTLWERSSVQLGLMFVVVAFIMCGVGAWAAGRAQRRQMVDLLATMPRPAALQDVTLLTSTVGWGLVACVVAGAYIFAVAHREATWGGPAWSPIVVGLLTVVTGTAVGYLGGSLIPSRFAAPLVAVGFSAVVLLVGTRSSAVAYLSPLSLDPRGYSPYDLFYRSPSVPVMQMCLWLAGVTSCTLALVVLRRHRALSALCMFAVALVIATSGAVLVMQAFVHPPWERIYPGQPLMAYEPTCVEQVILICVHPAYAAFVDGSAQRIGPLVEPLVGVPGGPVRAKQLPARVGLRSDGTLEIMPGALIAARAAYDLVHEPETELSPAQLVIAYWLMDRVGEPTSELWLFTGAGQPEATVAAAAARFAALDSGAQRAWLSAHFQDLRVGLIDLEDLP